MHQEQEVIPIMMKRTIMSGKYFWLAVTTDEYELPLVVTESPKELGQLLNVSKETIKSAVKRSSEKSMNGVRYIRVLKGEDNE